MNKKKNPEQISSGSFNYLLNLGSLKEKSQKSTCPTQSFSCPKKLIKISKTRE
jgi:hypothetical protein